MKKLMALAACLLFGVFGAAGETHAQIADINSAINKAGRQRMLSQRMAKLYMQLGLGVDSERSRRVLDYSLALFDRQLVELKNYAPTPAIRDTYFNLERAWLAYKDVLVGAAPSLEGARRVMALSEEVLALAHQGTVQLERHSGTTAGRLVNIAGRQRMLSQRLAKFHQASAWGAAPRNAGAELQQARKEFLEGLRELEAAPVNNDAIREELELGRLQWSFFEQALAGQGDDPRRLLTNVATTSERILEVMDNVTGLYEKLPQR